MSVSRVFSTRKQYALLSVVFGLLSFHVTGTAGGVSDEIIKLFRPLFQSFKVEKDFHALDGMQDHGLCSKDSSWMPQLNVLDFGAKGDGVTNDTQAILSALRESVASSSKEHTGSVLLPEGHTFLSWPLLVETSYTRICIEGVLLVPPRSEWSRESPSEAFLHIMNSDHTTVAGAGTIQGQGQEWWDVREDDYHIKAPKLLYLERCKSCHVWGLRLHDSPQVHLQVEHSSDVDVMNVSVKAPAGSPNTDGIVIKESSMVHVKGCKVQTGDDNVVLKHGTKDVVVENCTFGSGHGASIGSLGEHGDEGSVSNATFRFLLFNGTDRGARIKTWQGGTGEVRDVRFQDLDILNAPKSPILIDQFYCPHSQHESACSNSPLAIQIRHVQFVRINATTTNELAIDVRCSETIPCTKIRFEDVDIQRYCPEKHTHEHIHNRCEHISGVGINNLPAMCFDLSERESESILQEAGKSQQPNKDVHG